MEDASLSKQSHIKTFPNTPSANASVYIGWVFYINRTSKQLL